MFALVDCNNFYASCERVFNPRLATQPIVVLSNNDGCIIARSNEAKQLGIPMGAPFFQWRKFCRAHHVQVFSSNYELYGDMSQRVMTVLNELFPTVEVYSIDEAFLSLHDFKNYNLIEYAESARKKIRTWLGLPVSIGIAPTKTLAKIANHIAKNHATSGVFAFADAAEQATYLASFPVDKIWGIGRRMKIHLEKLNIHTAEELQQTDPKKIRHYFNVTIEKTVQELNGISCIETSTIQPKKQIISSRSFGKTVNTLTELEEAVSHYAAIGCMKLRKQHHSAHAVYVFLETQRFNNEKQRPHQGISMKLPYATAETSHIISMAKQGLKKLYRPNCSYQKAGIVLLDLIPTAQQQLHFFTTHSPNTRLMETVDNINQLFGKKTIFYAAEGIQREWQIKTAHLTPRYTTRWHELLRIK